MTPLYWIDGCEEYDREMFKSGLGRFAELVEPIAQKYDISIEYINIADLFFGYSAERPHIFYDGEDILQKQALAYIPYTNPHPQTERILHSLAHLVQVAPNWTQINVPLHLDRDKDQAFYLSSLIGAKPIPSWLIPHRTTSRMQIELIEKQLGSYPFIIKPTSMLAGIGIIKVNDRDSLGSLLDYCGLSSRSYIIQPYLKGAVDYRVYLENYDVIACQKRTPPSGGFLSNVSQRGGGEAVQVDPKISAQSIALAKHLTDGYICVDWLVADDGVFLSEIDFCGMFFGLPAEERNRVIHAFFRSALNKRGGK